MEIVFTCAYCETVHFEVLSHCLSCGAPYSQVLPPSKRLNVNEIVDSIIKICKKYEKNNKFYWGDQIPEKRLKKVVKQFGVTREENVILIYDNTIFGSNKDGLVICTNGIYWRNPKYIDPNQNFLSWHEFKKRKIKGNADQYNISLEHGDTIAVYGSQFFSLITQLFKEIQKLLIQHNFDNEIVKEL